MAFVAGAGIAGFGGGLLASFNGQANYDANFTFYFGLVWLVLVITAGSRSVQAAIISRHHVLLLPELLDRLFSWPGNYLASHPGRDRLEKSVLDFVNPEWALGVAFILFGFGALTYAKHPEGIIEAQTSMSIRRIAPSRRAAQGRARSPPAERRRAARGRATRRSPLGGVIGGRQPSASSPTERDHR